MRFEAKNHYIKRLVGLNFKNVPKTVAIRHQYNICLNLLAPPGSESKFLYKGDVIGKGMFTIPLINAHHNINDADCVSLLLCLL